MTIPAASSPHSPNETLRRQAYVDEELPIDDVIDLEATLTPRERAEIEGEMRFERALSQKLATDTHCSDELWARVKSQVVTASQSRLQPVVPKPVPVPRSRQLLALAWRPVAMAAGYAAAVVLTLAIVRFATREPVQTVVFADQPAVFAANVDVPGDYDKVMRALTAHGINVNLDKVALESGVNPPGHENLQLLGLRMHPSKNGDMAELLFSCCGKPVVVLVTAKAHAAALEKVEFQGLPPQWHAMHRTVDGFELKSVSSHNPQEILNLFS